MHAFDGHTDGRYERISIENHRFWSVLKLGGSAWPKISRTRGRPPSTVLCVRKSRWTFLSYGVRMSAELSFVSSQFTRVTDGQTDTFAIGKTACIQCSAVKIGLRVSVYLSVCGHSHGRISLSIFTKIGTDVKPLKGRTSSLGVNIAPPLPLFCPPTPILGQEVLKTHANIK